MPSQVRLKNILQLKAGKVVKINDHPLKGRLIALGILEGKSIEILRSSMFDGAYYVKIGNQVFGLRKEELEQIQVS